MTPIQQYIIAIRDHHPLGVKEQTHYPALSNLLNEIGKILTPKIRCVMHPAGQNANLPDGGFFSATQFPRQGDPPTVATTMPERGVIEAKPLSFDVITVSQSGQVKSYLTTYKQVLVTTYRDFLLVDLDPATNLVRPLERYTLAVSQEDFLMRAQSPKAFADIHDERLTQFLTRVMLHPVPLEDPKLLAFFLASYARDAKARIDLHTNLPALESIKAALEQSLGLSFLGPEGETFFRSTLVQTLFYGVFSAWVLWHNENPGRTDAFNWRNADWFIHVPFIRALFEQVATRAKLEPLGLIEPLDWASNALTRVRRRTFFANFNLDHAVTYFYEPFLQHFDPQLRKQLGVWYTPPEIVQYMVQRVDTVLREELGIPDGLAADNVFVLDPCCGTGAYLVEVLHRIEKTYKEKGEWDALATQRIKKASMERIVGFEIMPAPFVVSHLQLGITLQQMSVPFIHNQNERAAIYLTNSLTGWEPALEPKQHLMFPEMEAERDAALHIKQQEKILVILGNPPYNAFAGVSPEEEKGLVEPYKENLNTPEKSGGWGIKKFNLDDFYLRFFRVAERRITNGPPGYGIVCFISNASYLDDPSFVVMRKKMLQEFDAIWIDNLNGDSRETGKLTPQGKPDPSIFSTESQPIGIRVGTAIGLFARKSRRDKKPAVRYREFWGVTKRADLLASLNKKNFDKQYVAARPTASGRHSFRPSKASSEYSSWPKLNELAAIPPFNGPVERRNNSLIRISDPQTMLKHLKQYVDPHISDEKIAEIESAFMFSSGEFDAPSARAKLKGKHRVDPACVTRYPFKPFDIRYAYLCAELQPLFSRPSPQLLRQRFQGSRFFITRDTADKSPEGPPFYFSRLVCDYDCISGHARHFPVMLKNGKRLEKNTEATLFQVLGEKPDEDEPVANLSTASREYFAALKIKSPDLSSQIASLIWMNALSIGFAPDYLAENADGIRTDWPRMPLPNSRKILESSAILGQRVADILDTETQVKGVTSGIIRHELRTVSAITKVGGGNLNPANDELSLSAKWGHAGRSGIIMPGSGKIVERRYTDYELAAFTQSMALSPQSLVSLLGPTTTDIFLNQTAYWKNIPLNIWNYHIGGYQVLKKWLSYREVSILQRPLTPDEVREFRDIARCLTALILLTPQLNANYAAVKANIFDWPSSTR